MLHVVLITMYYSGNASRFFFLKNQITHTHMSDINIVSSYLIKINEIKYQLVVIEMNVENGYLVSIAMNEIFEHWESFLYIVHGHKNMHTFENLLDDLVQEETRRERIIVKINEIMNQDLID